MKHIRYCEHNLFIYQLDPNLVLNDWQFDAELNKAFNQANIECIEANIGLYQTIDSVLFKIPGFIKLMDYLYPVVNEVKYKYHITKPILSIRRFWANKIYKGCESSTHVHSSVTYDSCDFIGLFYYQADNLASQLILTELDTCGLKDIDIPKDKKQYIQVCPGMFLFHPPELVHAVSKHMSEQPRICFVFEFEFIDEDQLNSKNMYL